MMDYDLANFDESQGLLSLRSISRLPVIAMCLLVILKVESFC